MTTLKDLEEHLAFIRHWLHELRDISEPETVSFRLFMQEKEMELLERIGKLLDGPP